MMLTINDVNQFYGGSHILWDVSLTVPRGSCTVLMGRNGMGKTTLIRAIAGHTPPRTGEILFRGRPLGGLPPYAIAQGGIALVPQGRRIFGSLSVRENLLLPTSGLARPRNGRWNLEAVLREFPQLAERSQHPGRALSGGEQQMLAVGRALMANPELILMDEPSEGLSPKLVQQVGEIMRNLREHGHAVLLVEQNFALAMSVADYLYVVSAGRFVFEGTPQQLQEATDILDQHLGVARSH